MSGDAIDLGTCMNSRFPKEMHSWRAVSATTEFLVPLVEFRASPSTCQTSVARTARMSEIVVFHQNSCHSSAGACFVFLGCTS